jgi:ribosomal protein S11
MGIDYSGKKVCIGLRRNTHFSLRKSSHRTTKWVIPVQTGFNNTNITVTSPQCWVVFPSFASTYGFKSSRKASPYVDQRTTVDTICLVGMQGPEVMAKGAGSGRDCIMIHC